MTRKKVKLQYIFDEPARKATYRKRKKGIIKKVNELTTLCGVPACAIISSPFDSQPEIWPNPEGAKNVIERYQHTALKDDRKNVDQERFIVQMISKSQDQMVKVCHQNRQKELTMEMFKYMHEEALPENLTAEYLNDLNRLIEEKMNEVDTQLAKRE
ncbi:agamous-like MADS-box protein AGL80 [Lotus japonicus]|uniref:agamous-like MADS-box protein AGL80 n=1 Tax=Lotus japonicus TaxID=34305 RepID=UPI00258C2578|nr:agamous-like MADS-box protein AGL80 [Lotus japonicus]